MLNVKLIFKVFSVRRLKYRWYFEYLKKKEFWTRPSDLLYHERLAVLENPVHMSRVIILASNLNT